MAFDASGQIKRDNDSPIVTLTGVAVPIENADNVRGQIDREIRVKWKEGKLTAFKAAQRLIASQRLPTSVTYVTGVSSPPWQAFWDEGRQAAKILEEETGMAAHFAAGDAMSRSFLFANVFAHCAALVLKIRGWRAPTPQGHSDSVEFLARFDTDIQDPEARAVFLGTLQNWAASSRFAEFVKLQIDVDGSFHTEQEEPLILLADYVAGVFNHAHPDALIGRPVAPLKEVRYAAQQFRDIVGSRLLETSRVFEERHPLGGMSGQLP